MHLCVIEPNVISQLKPYLLLICLTASKFYEFCEALSMNDQIFSLYLKGCPQELKVCAFSSCTKRRVHDDNICPQWD